MGDVDFILKDKITIDIGSNRFNSIKIFIN